MKTIKIHLPDTAICGEFVYVNVSAEEASLNALAIHDIQDGNNYAPESMMFVENANIILSEATEGGADE